MGSATCILTPAVSSGFDDAKVLSLPSNFKSTIKGGRGGASGTFTDLVAIAALVLLPRSSKNVGTGGGGGAITGRACDRAAVGDSLHLACSTALSPSWEALSEIELSSFSCTGMFGLEYKRGGVGGPRKAFLDVSRLVPWKSTKASI